MELHERYVNFPTANISIVELLEITFKDDPFSFLHRLINNYNSKLPENNLSLKELEIFRMLLCYEYQLVFNSEKKYKRVIPKDICFQNIESTLYSEEQLKNNSRLDIFYDISILHMTLYCKPQCIQQHFTNFQNCLNTHFLNDTESRTFFMKIMECFLEALQLRQFLYDDIELSLLDNFNCLFLKDIMSWLSMKENKEWRLFACIFPKFIQTFGFEKVVPIVWKFVLNKLQDEADLFAALSIMVDTCYSVDTKQITITHYALCYMEQLWLLIIKGLKSSIQQYRKQALFLMKKVIKFISETNQNSSKLDKPAVVPFVCNQAIKTNLSISVIKEKYFLILEALEEKQHHLIAPALTHLPSLIKGNQEHSLCNDCFNIIWMQLIFERILKHENNAIVKQGILNICELDPIILDYKFLQVYINVLNNIYLYECQHYEDEPDMLSDVVTLFMHKQQKETDFIITVFKIMSEITWCPISLFYMLKTLRTVTCKTTVVWKNDDLNVITSLVQKNLNIHSHILRIASQAELLEIIANCLQKINDLIPIANVLFEFPHKEALTRGTTSWDTVTMWLREILAEENAINFIQLICKSYSLQNAEPEISPQKFAFMILILHDAGLILCNRTCPAKKILNNWLSSLNGVDMRPYADVMSYINITEFMSCLFQLNEDKPSENIIHLLSLHIDAALKFLLRNMRTIAFKLSYENVNKYLDIVVSFFGTKDLIMSKKQSVSYAEKFQSECIDILESVNEYLNVHYLCGLRILHACQDVLSTSHSSLYIKPLLNFNIIKCFDHDNNKGEIDSKGKIASDYYLTLAKLQHQYITSVPIEKWINQINWHLNISSFYEMGGKEIITEIAETLKVIIEKEALRNSTDELNFQSIFTICWRCIFLSKKNRLYFTTIQKLMGVIINNNFLILPDAMNFISQFLDEVLEEGNNVPKLKKILLTEMDHLEICYLRNFHEALLSCLLHGDVIRKDKKIESQSYLYTFKHYKQCYPQNISVIDFNNDTAVRALSAVLLHKILNADTTYTSLFLPIVLKKLEKYGNKRYFNHSYIHKVKTRIMQTLLILQPSLNRCDTIVLQECICNLMLLESNQHSVRLMQEWILIKIFIDNFDLHDKLWNFFEEGIKVRPNCTSSIATIVYHVAQHLPNNLKATFICKAIKYVARCCLGQQYNMRLYNQVIFLKLYELLDKFNCNEIILEYKGLYITVIESLEDGRSLTNADKILHDFFFSVFHPIKDYSLQTIYFELPRLTGVDANEWSNTELFNCLTFKQTANQPLQLYNLNTSLAEIQTSLCLKKSSTDDTELLGNNIEMNCNGLSDIQKKIQTMTLSTSDINEIFSTIRETISQKKILRDNGIIVVASLIDRIPNLGGLARTCEIFNVKELVIDNLNCIKNKDFQSLSVSAEKWINITEVKCHQLKEYLLKKKNKGWCLVGVEQTANSTNLLDMEFAKKTILVLGNEKDGIPASLIPLFDTCVEIPQTGVIRSLNVHVSGAICIWQYAKQHILI